MDSYSIYHGGSISYINLNWHTISIKGRGDSKLNIDHVHLMIVLYKSIILIYSMVVDFKGQQIKISYSFCLLNHHIFVLFPFSFPSHLDFWYNIIYFRESLLCVSLIKLWSLFVNLIQACHAQFKLWKRKTSMKRIITNHLSIV